MGMAKSIKILNAREEIMGVVFWDTNITPDRAFKIMCTKHRWNPKILRFIKQS